MPAVPEIYKDLGSTHTVQTRGRLLRGGLLLGEAVAGALPLADLEEAPALIEVERISDSGHWPRPIISPVGGSGVNSYTRLKRPGTATTMGGGERPRIPVGAEVEPGGLALATVRQVPTFSTHALKVHTTHALA